MILRQEDKAVKAAEKNLERLYDDIDDLDESIVHTLEECLCQRVDMTLKIGWTVAAALQSQLRAERVVFQLKFEDED